ncbi:PD-(D/E)XK nuclease family transposase [Candidatus Parabeggiatoa sp. HSG14]|uniref:PD-(D/E)XK nuclease family transposase n=1 Tax=Candidatus Parabeggiatoa sp. HSG14 TaxID=3055593 RepID=UPI0025A79C19|nr:PD-(D/E)XK nuclease family transposase [Thiotrichales bacterium HSG14]
MHLSPLDNEVFFKKAFTDKLVFTQFVKDIIGIDIKVGKIETEKRFKPKVAYIDFAYDIFAESKDNRIIIEIQRVNYDYSFDRFLHYHNMAIAELQRNAKDYRIKPTVYTIVVLTASDIIEDKDSKAVEEDVLISDVNPHNLKGKTFNLYGHQLVFLNPNFKNDNTPPRIKDWLDLILDSIENPDNPKINLKNKAIKKAAKLIDDDNLTPEDRRAAKIAFATEETRKIVERKAEERGHKEGEKIANLKTAQKMIAEGFEVTIISKMTGLDVETIYQLETGEYYDNNTD